MPQQWCNGAVQLKLSASEPGAGHQLLRRQQMNIFAVGFPVTVSVGLIGMLLTLPKMQMPFTRALERRLYLQKPCYW